MKGFVNFLKSGTEKSLFSLIWMIPLVAALRALQALRAHWAVPVPDTIPVCDQGGFTSDAERVFYNNNILLNVAKFLELQDVVNLSRLNKTTRAAPLLEYTTKARINSVFPVPEGFYLSGGFLLSVLMNSMQTVDIDVDLYTNSVTSEECEALFQARGLRLLKTRRVYFGNCVWIEKVQTFTDSRNTLKVDVIYVTSGISVQSMMSRNFDFSCVKNIYWESNGVPRLCIKSVCAIANHKTVLDNYKNTYFTRLKKYLDRGYIVYGVLPKNFFEIARSLVKINLKFGTVIKVTVDDRPESYMVDSTKYGIFIKNVGGAYVVCTERHNKDVLNRYFYLAGI